MSFEAAVLTNLVAWVLYSLVFVVMLSTRKRSERQRDWSMRVGLSLHVLGMLVVPATLRPTGSPLFPSAWAYGGLLEQLVRITVVLLEVGSIWLTLAAIRTLGKQWSVSARLVADHQLIRSGPYGLVRHPIYTALVAMVVGSALTASTWEGVIAAAAISALAAWIRVRSEENLMRQTFGAEYASYARAVPALVPWLRLRRTPPSII